ncbi:hypothetical protein ACI1US_02342 [Leucobacter sp. BZR 635]
MEHFEARGGGSREALGEMLFGATEIAGNHCGDSLLQREKLWPAVAAVAKRLNDSEVAAEHIVEGEGLDRIAAQPQIVDVAEPHHQPSWVARLLHRVEHGGFEVTLLSR